MDTDSIKREDVNERENSDPLPDNWNFFQSLWIRCCSINSNQVDRWILERYNPFILFGGTICYIILLLS